MSDPFAARLPAWEAYQRTPWGRVRQAVVAHTLDVVTAGREGLAVLDVGGGDGLDALHLAGRGHHVTVADPSAGLLARAGERAAAAGLADRVDLVQAGVDALPRRGATGFDLVLCHNVLQYLPDARAGIAAVVRATEPGGLVSLLAPNPAAEAVLGVLRGGRPAAARERLAGGHARSVTFDRDVADVDAATAEAALVGAGCEPVAHFGVRCVIDAVPDGDGRKDDPAWFAELLELELALCDRPAHRGTARFWQLVARPF